MAGIIYDARRMKVLECLIDLCEYTGESEAWMNQFWEDLMQQEDVFRAFVYYLEHHNLTEELKCSGYSLIDLFVWQMNCDNLLHDTGKNTNECNKERMVLQAFREMLDMKKNPEAFIKRMQDGRGMDKFY